MAIVKPLKKDYRQQSVRLQVAVYELDTQIRFVDFATPGKGNIRGIITRFSQHSQKRFSLLMRNTIQHFQAMIGLTYPESYPVDIAISKKHINAFCQWLRRKKIKYIWTMEFQERGAVHYHMVVDGWIDKDELARRWADICNTKDPAHVEHGTSIQGIEDREKAVQYMCSYMKKLSQKIAPGFVENLGRYWGATRNLLQAKAEVTVKRIKISEIHKALRIVRRYYVAKMKEWKGRKFRWTTRGFIAWGGTRIIDRLFEAGLLNFREVPTWHT